MAWNETLAGRVKDTGNLIEKVRTLRNTLPEGSMKREMLQKHLTNLIEHKKQLEKVLYGRTED